MRRMYPKLFDKELVDLNCISCSQQTPLDPGLPSDGTGQPVKPLEQALRVKPLEQGGLVYDEPNTGPRNLSSVL